MLFSPILMVADYHHELYFDGSTVAVCLTQADTFWPALFFISSIAVFFALPLVILVALYFIIARHLMAHPGIIALPCRWERQQASLLSVTRGSSHSSHVDLSSTGCHVHYKENILNYCLNPYTRVLLEKLTGSQLVKKFLAFYGTRRFITAFTSASHLAFSWARSIHSMPPHPTSWRSILTF